MKKQHGREFILAKRFDVHPRLFAYMLGFNIESKSSEVNELRVSDLYIMDKVFHGMVNVPGIQLAPIIFKSMWDIHKHKIKNKNFLYPVLISKLLVRLRVNVENEQVLHTTEKE